MLSDVPVKGFRLNEIWADREGVLQVQMHRDYRQLFWARLPEPLAEPRLVQTSAPMRSNLSTVG